MKVGGERRGGQPPPAPFLSSAHYEIVLSGLIDNPKSPISMQVSCHLAGAPKGQESPSLLFLLPSPTTQQERGERAGWAKKGHQARPSRPQPGPPGSPGAHGI